MEADIDPNCCLLLGENIFISTVTSAIYNLHFIPIKNSNIISDSDSWESVDAKIGHI